MLYRVDLTLESTVYVEAEDEQDAMEIATALPDLELGDGITDVTANVAEAVE